MLSCFPSKQDCRLRGVLLQSLRWVGIAYGLPREVRFEHASRLSPCLSSKQCLCVQKQRLPRGSATADPSFMHTNHNRDSLHNHTHNLRLTMHVCICQHTQHLVRGGHVKITRQAWEGRHNCHQHFSTAIMYDNVQNVRTCELYRLLSPGAKLWLDDMFTLCVTHPPG